jgi:hypothetical protein
MLELHPPLFNIRDHSVDQNTAVGGEPKINRDTVRLR